MTANTNFYAAPAPTGNDANDGLTVGTPKTFMGMYNFICNAYDLGGHRAFINLAAGTYTDQFLNQAWIGGGRVLFIGDTVTPSNVLINCSVEADAMNVGTIAPGAIVFQGCKFVSANGDGLSFGTINCGSGNMQMNNCEFGAVVGSQIHITGTTTNFLVTDVYTISGNATNHVLVESGAAYVDQGNGITLTGVPAFSGAFAATKLTGTIDMTGNLFTGTATGSQFNINTGVFTAVGAGTIPGSTAGTVSNGGVFIQ